MTLGKYGRFSVALILGLSLVLVGGCGDSGGSGSGGGGSSAGGVQDTSSYEDDTHWKFAVSGTVQGEGRGTRHNDGGSWVQTEGLLLRDGYFEDANGYYDGEPGKIEDDTILLRLRLQLVQSGQELSAGQYTPVVAAANLGYQGVGGDNVYPQDDVFNLEGSSETSFTVNLEEVKRDTWDSARGTFEGTLADSEGNLIDIKGGFDFTDNR